MSDIETQLIDRQTLVKLLEQRTKERDDLIRAVADHVTARGELAAQNQHLVLVLKDIGDFSHDRSQGPAVSDDLWEVRRIAYEALALPDLASPVLNKIRAGELQAAIQTTQLEGAVKVAQSLRRMADAIEKGEGL